MTEVPIWDNQEIYTSFVSTEWARDQKTLTDTSARLLRLIKRLDPLDKQGFPGAIADLLRLFDRCQALSEQLGSFAYLMYSTNTQDEKALKELNAIEELSLPLRDAQVRFRSIWGTSSWTVKALIRVEPTIAPYSLLLQEAKIWAQHQMSEAEESLAADLLRSGGEAWGRLQEAVSSTLNVVWDNDKLERKTVVELRSMASDRDRSVRKKAWELEIQAWKTVEVPLAAALNGVKGQTNVLSLRRGWKSPLEQSALQSRIAPASLEALISALKESLPIFRRYLMAKAGWLKLDRCSFYDLFAPVGQVPSYDFLQAQQIIETAFGTFSPGMAAFARLAFEKKWIHAKPQPGKVGGAYCISLPLSKQPRILSNFDGTFGEVKTLAHELGHGWHFWLLRHKPQTWRDYPMTLAETASIFAETVLQDTTLGLADEGQAIFMLDQSLQDSTQVIVDILSRYNFENAIFERRTHGELSASEFCDLMSEAQRSTYGDALAELHPYMWAVKGHYYRPNLAFYNYPYAFGQLFGLALFARAKAEGPSFGRTYQRLLEGTGIRTADQLAADAGFDLSDPSFWRMGLNEIEKNVERFERRHHE